MAWNFDEECFFIAPIGEDGSPERKRSDGILKAIVQPAAAAHGLRAVRADAINDPGTISAQIVEHLINAKVVVADLSGGNPNVFYELAVRDAKQMPTAMIAELGTNLPFDKAPERTIFLDSTDLASAWDAKDRLTAALGAALAGEISNPIAAAMVWKEYAASGKPVEEAIAQLADQMSQIAADVHSLKRKEEIRQAEGKAQSEAMAARGMARWSTVGGATFGAAVSGAEMSEYDRLHGWVPQGGAEAPIQSFRGVVGEDALPKVDEPPRDES